MPSKPSDVDFISESMLKELAEFDASGALVTTLYMDVSGKTHPRKSDYVAKAQSLLSSAKRRFQAAIDDKHSRAAVAADLRIIKTFLEGEFRRRSAEGLAVFASSEIGFFKYFVLAHPPKDRVVIDESPFIRPLSALLSEYRRFGIVLVGRKTARLLVFYMGAMIEEAVTLDDDVPGQHDQGGWSQARFSRHIEEEVTRHLKRTASEAVRVFRRADVDQVVIGSDKEIAEELCKAFPSWLARKVARVVRIKQDAKIEEIAAVVSKIESEIEAQEDRELVEKLRAGMSTGRSVAGLAGTLSALGEQRAQTLLVSRGYVCEGWKCSRCQRLSALGPVCRFCSSKMNRVPDVVEEAIEEALGAGVKIELVTGNGDLDVLGRIGALLRY